MTGEQSLGPAHEYLRDAWHQSILFLDALRQRGNIYREHQEKLAKGIVRDHYLLLRIDEERAVTAIPKLLPRDPEECARALRGIQRIALAPGEQAAEGKRRLARIEKLFGTKAEPATRKEGSDVRA